MRPAPFILITLLATVLTTGVSHAQSYGHDKYAYDKNEVSLSEGIITVEQVNGWDGRGGASGYVSMPSALTGASFLTYRHFFTRRFALGGTFGIDNESGDLSYGNPETNATGFEGTSGHYNVRTYTLTVEALCAYVRKQRFMFYGFVGMGATEFKDNYYFYPNAPYSPPVTFPTNPYDYHATYFNAQVTPLGIRFGEMVAGFVEFGFGYKGLFNGGLSVSF